MQDGPCSISALVSIGETLVGLARKTAAAALLTRSFRADLPSASRPAPPGAQIQSSAAESADEARQAAYAGSASWARLPCARSSTACPRAPTCICTFPARFMPRSFLRAAGEDGLCVDPHALSFVETCGLSAEPGSACVEGAVPPPAFHENQHLYDAVIDAFSMRSFVPATATPATIISSIPSTSLAALARRTSGEWIDEIVTPRRGPE